MRRKTYFIIAITLVLVVLGTAIAQAQGPKGGLKKPATLAGTGFTYQGQLKKSGAPVTGICTFNAGLWDAASAGTQQGITQTVTPVNVSNGLFYVGNLNDAGQFGTSALNGDARYLQLAVRCSGDFTPIVLDPRQQINPAPYALFAAAPWVTNGSNIAYNAGNVGIGTSAPSAYGHGGTNTILEIQNAATASNSQAHVMLSTGSTVSGSIGSITWAAPNSAGVEQRAAVISSNLETSAASDVTGRVSVWTNNAGVLSEKMRITPSGNVGIGTVSPSSRLTLHGKDPGSYIGYLMVEDSAANTKAYVDDFGLYVNRYIFVGDAFQADGQTGNVRINGNVDIHQSESIGGVLSLGTLSGTGYTHICWIGTFLSACGSAAEYVPTIDDGSGYAQTADLVSIPPSAKNPYDDEHSPFVVTKSVKPCDDNLIGFIANPELGADGKKLNDHYLPLAIYGYFPAKVTLENGAIYRGDPITSSSKPGYGMKATEACKIIGYALEDAAQEGTIQVFANHGETAVAEVAALRVQVQELQQVAAGWKQDKATASKAQQMQIDSLEARVASLEQQASRGQSPATDPQQVMLGFGALVMLGVVYQQQRAMRGGG